HPAYADRARRGQRLETGRDIDAVAEDVVPIDDNIAHVEPDAELNAAFGWHIHVALGHLALDVDGAPNRIDDAGELDEQAVAGGLDDAAAMFGDFRLQNC